MATNFEVRLLLELSAFDDVPIGLGKLNKQFSGKAADKNAARERLVASGAIATDAKTKGFTLTETGRALLAKSLVSDTFEFKASFGKRTANVLLKWFRSNPVTSAEPVAKTAGSTIESYEAFKVVALEIYDQLNRDFNLDHLVPIYRMRRVIGDRVKRSDFNEWLLKMQTEKIFRLQGGSVEDSAPDKIEDSITTEISGLRCFAKRL